MGYSTEFKGQLKFINVLNVPELAYLSSLLDIDARSDMPDAIFPDGKENIAYIQFELTKDFTGIQWDGSEKFYYATEAANFIIANMQAIYPDFGLSGELLAQGEECGDIWKLKIVDGKAVKLKLALDGDIVDCPHCHKQFVFK